MNLRAFEAERGGSWSRLGDLLTRAGTRPSRLEPGALLELGALYREASADLAFARRRFPGDPVVARLEELVVRGRGAVYGHAQRGGRVREFVTRGYWRRLAERPVLLLVAWALLVVPALAAGLWALSDPSAALAAVPGELQGAADPPASGRDFGAGEGAAFSTKVMVNNIQVTFLAFAGGITAGAVTILAMVFNGAILGIVAGLAIDAGNGTPFLRLVSAHGPLELSCIVCGGVAGLRMGWALIAPGAVTRGRALRREARAAVEIALGTAPVLVLCGFAEGFLTGPSLPVAVQTAIGIALFAAFWGLVAWRGSGRAGGRGRGRARHHSRARDFARR